MRFVFLRHNMNSNEGFVTRFKANKRKTKTSKNVWSVSALANLTEEEVRTLLAEIPSDGESADEYEDGEEEEEEITFTVHEEVAPQQNESDSEND
ncbi:hypothetical protein QE152_g6119 [Popillia japonica]|uniref:Uncharacterized protein n=1 Tax=Popillia japonica TaxID=7064 RepID=A0AAW1MI92_POPJA